MADTEKGHDTLTGRRRPATNPEARENQVINAAYNLAEKQILEGTASSQVITHFLKLGSSRERKEQDILSEQKTLLKAKTEAIESSKNADVMYKEVLDAMRKYSGNDVQEDEDA